MHTHTLTFSSLWKKKLSYICTRGVYHQLSSIRIQYISRYKCTVHIRWSHICSDVFESHMHLAVCMDMYFETPSLLTPFLRNFAVALFASDHAYTLLSWYEYFYITTTIVNFTSIYQYIGISCTSLIRTYTYTHKETQLMPPSVG